MGSNDLGLASICTLNVVFYVFSIFQSLKIHCNKKNIKKKKDKRHRLNGSVFCNMSLGEELTIIFMNMTQVIYVGRHPQP